MQNLKKKIARWAEIRMDIQRKESVNSKIDQGEVSNLNKRERKRMKPNEQGSLGK